MDVVQALAIGVVSGLTASFLWLIIFRIIRPRLDLSARITEDRNEAGKFYQIKIINRSRRPTYEIKIELCEIRPRRTRGGIIDCKFPIPVQNAPFMLSGHTNRNKEYANCYRLTINDLRSYVNSGDSDYIRLRVLARDSLSGIGRVFEQRYYDEDDIVAGRFAMGESFEIVRVDDHLNDASPSSTDR